MFISKIKIESYKSFEDSGEINFKPGINIIIGQNNSGKTALLEALSLTFMNKPHKSEGTSDNSDSSVEVTFTISADEFRDKQDTFNYYSVLLPYPADGRVDFVREAFNKAIDTGVNIKAKVSAGGIRPNSLDYGLYQQREIAKSIYFVDLTKRDGNKYEAENQRQYDREPNQLFGWSDIQSLIKRIYRFHAERMTLSSHAVGHKSILRPDASNLAEVLQVIHTKNPARFDRLMQYVSEVIPSVKWVTAVTDEQSVIHINIWPIDRKTERADLAIELSEAGTGIGQILSILFVVLNADQPSTIIIDEPQSFLHPGAAKKLMKILNSFPQHQYFISTHSPEVLTAANPSSITALEYEEGVTTARTLNLAQTGELKSILDDIGIGFSDVFFAEKILWVEGPTEAKAFPMILDPRNTNSFTDVTVLPLVNTGDIKSKKHVRKHARAVFDIYHKLSGAHALAPPIVGVVLDREDSKDQEMRELEKISQGLLKFLPRRMYENYLLDSEAIASVANNQENFSKEPITADQVREWLETKRSFKKYLPDSLKDSVSSLDYSKWLRVVDAAKLLEDLFRELSETVTYLKTTHSIEITSWLLENNSDEIEALRKFLKSIVEAG